MLKISFAVLSLLFLLYLVMPGPSSVDDFSPLPNSAKSTLSGDTWQVPNVTGYFSFHFRDYVIPFYFQNYRQQVVLPFPPLKLNYPPEYAYTAIKDQTPSTFLEEFIYPLRDSLFVNGLEPFDKNGESRYQGAVPFKEEGGVFDNKTTIRFYPSPLWVRIMVWVGINVSVVLLWKLGKRVVLNG